jgi:hypothetical protein
MLRYSSGAGEEQQRFHEAQKDATVRQIEAQARIAEVSLVYFSVCANT